jgi:hypothetical protein
MIDPNRFRKANFLRAADLTATRTRVRIDGVTLQEVNGEERLVLTFTSPGLKPRVCGYENTVALVDGLGPDETKWPGAVIILRKEKRNVRGEIKDSIAIEVPKQQRTDEIHAQDEDEAELL